MLNTINQKIQDQRFGGIDTLVTCGNQSDPRIQFSLDLLDPLVPDALTLVFRSDSTVRKRGIYLVISEINTSVRINVNVLLKVCI